MDETKLKRGAFIVIEGLDRSGKSTQAKRLVERLEKTTKAKLVKFPNRSTPIGKMIDAYLRSQSELDDRAIHLLFSANRWECATAIENDLKSGITVICDRYAFSGIAFSAVKPGLTYEWCKSPDISLPAPDLVLFLEVHPDVARERGGYGEERYEKEALQARVREVFKKIELDTSQSSEVLSWRNIDASKSMAIVEEAIWTVVQPFSDGIYHDIQQLWT